ncbi:hypothetical protein SerAS12_2705 [Serratia sp. AS12]|uniref:hypothetical protein n=1 Tax=Serratia TaxID=613 RepID=UPI00020EA0B9|nr:MULTISPECIES: hypothetical protein [Serratia]AEF45825.1 hypothetical protein SerAS9_2704 [Serratia plymuthica AS9]AEF50776.1 hypothetical protein SerAS12_2705 [Serratia sp. AS12]AEG28483.1 hypothetical protein SerAS13_2706 [Serratia sp. AS13]UTN94583.1 hypothetical protein NLX81_13785 [Serratia plymuthica]
MTEIVFQPACATPSKSMSNDYVIINECEGYSLVKAVFDKDGEFTCFIGWVGGDTQTYSPQDYSVWALLPSSANVISGHL